MSFVLPSLAFLLAFARHVLAESHTVRFQNNCGTGTPKLIQAGKVLSTGEDYISNGPLESAIAYLDRNNECLLNGENCAIVEMNLNNPSCAGCGSSVDISLIPSHAFNVGTAFAFFGGGGDACDGLGAVCADANCDTAFFASDDNQVQRACQANNVNLLITFCGGGSSRFTEAIAGSLSGQSSSSGSDSASQSDAAFPSSSTETAPPASSQTAVTPPTTSPAPTSPARSSSPDTEASQTAVENVGGSSAIPSASAIASAKTTSPPACRRKNSRSRRAKRASPFSRHVRSQNRARAFSGIRDSQV